MSSVATSYGRQFNYSVFKKLCERNSWSEAKGEVLVLLAMGDSVPLEEGKHFLKLGNLAPTDWQTPVGVEGIARQLKKVDVIEEWVLSEGVGYDKAMRDEVVWQRILDGSASDEEWLSWFPARSKSDIAIRISRARDTFGLDGRNEVLERCRLQGLDYILTVNLVRARHMFGSDWWQTILEMGLLDGGLTCFVERAKKLSDLVKTTTTRLEPRLNFVELGGLSGYRNPPWPGFDMFEEAKKLAQPEPVEHSMPGITFVEAVEVLDVGMPDKRKQISLEDFVKSGMWVTSGSSSVGRVEWSYEGVSGRFKARKNMVLEIYEPDELWAMYQAWDGKQTNFTLKKSELGKIRIAVSSDLFTFLDQSYLVYYLNGVYTRWPGSTIEERLPAESDRLVRMLQMLISAYGLPFDYSGFDHQPTLNELVMMIRVLGRMALRSCDFRSDLTLVIDRTSVGMMDATLTTRDGEVEEVINVSGGLMSGLRLTSVLGNGWNTVITEMVLRMLTALAVDREVAMRYIRGDDSALADKIWTKCYLMQAGYTGLNVIGGAGKFSIWKGQTEFLRQWYSDRISAYPARVIPTWLQRKPWSSDGWSVGSAMMKIATARDTLVRRGVASEKAWFSWNVTVSLWCRLTRISRRWVGVPQELGGLGLEPWDGWIPSRSLVTVVPRGVVVDLADATSDGFLQKWASYGVTADRDAANKAALDHFNKKLADDDVRGVAHIFRRAANDNMKAMSVSWRRRVKVPIPTWTSWRLSMLGVGVGVLDNIDRPYTSFGQWSRYQPWWLAWQEIFRYTGQRVSKIDRPEFWWALDSYEKQGLKRRQALGWMFGDLSFGWSWMNPVVSQVWKKSATMLIGEPLKRKWAPDEWSSTIDAYSTLAQTDLEMSPWYRTLFNN
jgi:hypothetical protein